MFSSKVVLRGLPQALPHGILQNTSRKSLARSTSSLNSTQLGPPSRSRTISSTPSSQLPRTTRRKPCKPAARGPPSSVVAASLTFGFLYSLSWLLDIPPHKFLPGLIFDPPDDMHTLLDEDALAAVSYPEMFDFNNDHFFDTLLRARPLKYGHHLHKVQDNIRKSRASVAALEATLREHVALSPHSGEKQRSTEAELKRARELLRSYKVRWLKLFILDQREAAWRTQKGFRARTLQSVLREWMGRDVENLVGDLVRMGFVDVRPN